MLRVMTWIILLWAYKNTKWPQSLQHRNKLEPKRLLFHMLDRNNFVDSFQEKEPKIDNRNYCLKYFPFNQP